MAAEPTPGSQEAGASSNNWNAGLYDDQHSFVWKYGAELLDCVREHGVCVVPAFYPADVIDPIREACLRRMMESGDLNYADGSYKRVDAYKGTAAAPNELRRSCQVAGSMRHTVSPRL